VRKSREYEPDMVPIFRTTFSDGTGAWPQRDFQLATKQTQSRRQLWPRDVRDKHSDLHAGSQQALVIANALPLNLAELH
jgi:hypothetical protein